jgi:diguanylate cyclase (GGDEF)-like protein
LAEDEGVILITKRSIISVRAILAFASTLLFCLAIIALLISNRIDVQRLTMEQVVAEKSALVTETITKLLYKTQVISALVIRHNGDVQNFNTIASIVVDDPSILNVLIAPNGIVSEIYPMTDNNEQVIGYDMFGEGDGNIEARLARDIGKLVFGGPFNVMQGGQALVGRYSIWIDAADGSKKFWGLTSVTLRYPQVLKAAGLDTLNNDGFDYEIWRINPDTGERQTITQMRNNNADRWFIEKHMTIFNATWHFRVYPTELWYEEPQYWILAIMALAFSLLVGVIVQNNSELKSMKLRLENMVITDSMTGLLNRIGLKRMMDELIEAKTHFVLYYIDINQFKMINDTYGHSVGDYVLTEFSADIKKYLSKEDIFARVGGDEFVLVLPNADDDYLERLWTNVEKIFQEPIFTTNDGTPFRLTFSKGIARYPEDGSIEEIMSFADKNMYIHKQGR